MMREMNILEYLKDRQDGDIVVDLRSETMYAFGTIPGAINIPVERIGWARSAVNLPSCFPMRDMTPVI